MQNQVVEFKQVQQEGIDFYVSVDGKLSGMSMRGLAAFIGVSPSTVINLIQLIESSDSQTEKNNVKSRFQQLPESLKSIADKLFIICSAKLEKGASRLLNSIACAKLVHYYAYENEKITEEVKQQARHAYQKFAERGLHEYIKDISGFIEQEKQDELLSMMRTLITKVDNLENTVKEYHAIREKSSKYPGADFLLDEWAKSEKLAVETQNKLLNSEGISLEAWLYSKGISLDKSTKHRFALLVAETYRSVKNQNPPKGKQKLDGKIKYTVSLYTIEDVPILQMCLNKIMN